MWNTLRHEQEGSIEICIVLLQSIIKNDEQWAIEIYSVCQSTISYFVLLLFFDKKSLKLYKWNLQ